MDSQTTAESRFWVDAEETWDGIGFDEPDDLENGKGGHRSRLFGGLWMLGAALVVVSGTVGWFLHSGTGSQPSLLDTASSSVTDSVAMAADGSSGYRLEVDVQGDVHHPGLVSLPDPARVNDAIRAAGGFVHAADSALVNTAALVTDGEEVVIPGPTSQTTEAMTNHPSPSGGVSNVSSAQGTLIDLNTATESTLETLPDIGPGRASAIIAYRSSHGNFVSLSQLRQVHGIGPTIFARIGPFLSLGSSQP